MYLQDKTWRNHGQLPYRVLALNLCKVVLHTRLTKEVVLMFKPRRLYLVLDFLKDIKTKDVFFMNQNTGIFIWFV
jgi:hypothetical protein